MQPIRLTNRYICVESSTDQDMNVFAKRLKSARLMAGLSLQGLADKLGSDAVSKQALNKYEQGLMHPDSKVLIALSKALELPVDFFYAEFAVDVELEQVEYRKYNSKVKKSEKDSIEEKTKMKVQMYLELEDLLSRNVECEYFRFKKPVTNSSVAEEAARQLRSDWDLGYDPIPDVVEMLEDKGYRVVEVDGPEGFDGLTALVNNEPIIALNCNEDPSGDRVRKRFTALHELAHHALVFPKETSHKEMEKLCHVFASAVLFPEEMARKELSEKRFHFYERELVLLKERWGISIAAIFSRALQLGIISGQVHKRFFIGYRQRGYHKNGEEPGNFCSKEKPVLMERLVYIGLAQEVLTLNESARFLNMSTWALKERISSMT